MATKKKAGRKTKAKRKKTRAAKPAARRKTTAKKKSAKKAPARRARRKKAKPATQVVAKRTPARRPVRPVAVAATAAPAAASVPAQTAAREERIGVVTHYYSHLSVATLQLESGTLRVGDTIHIRGHTTDFTQRVESLEVDHAPATEVRPGDDFGLKVIEHAREHDVVYKLAF